MPVLEAAPGESEPRAPPHARRCARRSDERPTGASSRGTHPEQSQFAVSTSSLVASMIFFRRPACRRETWARGGAAEGRRPGTWQECQPLAAHPLDGQRATGTELGAARPLKEPWAPNRRGRRHPQPLRGRTPRGGSAAPQDWHGMTRRRALSAPRHDRRARLSPWRALCRCLGFGSVAVKVPVPQRASLGARRSQRERQQQDAAAAWAGCAHLLEFSFENHDEGLVWERGGWRGGLRGVVVPSELWICTLRSNGEGGKSARSLFFV